MKKKVGILGVTGSIGRQAVDVIKRNHDRYEVVFVTAHTDSDGLFNAANEVGASHALLTAGGMKNLNSLINDVEIDIALVGAAGTQVLSPAYELAKKGITLAIANKECIVAAGKLITKAAAESGTKIIPVDSEHSALFQSMQGSRKDDIDKLLLTASGGAFRDVPASQMRDFTASEALKHPNWSMGQKITIDSATMMNKGLELIEARFLFDMPADKLQVVVHPQSVVHSMVSYIDGSIIAQLGSPDMRGPIAYSLSYPERIETGVKPLDFSQLMSLTFYPPDLDKYPCLRIALEVLKSDNQSKMIAMNAANEVVVEHFLKERLKYSKIAEIIENVVSRAESEEPHSIAEVLLIDANARELTEEVVKKL